MPWLIGVDVGGTFTDFYAFETLQGRHHVHKVPSTPANPALAIIAGLREFAGAAAIDFTAVDRLSHGTTVATNTLLQRKGAHVVLATTQGFKDLIEIGRQVRPKMYDLQEDNPAPVVGPLDRIEVAERVLASGKVHLPLDERGMDRAIADIIARQPEACAVCFLFSFVNRTHEEAFVGRLRQQQPNLFISQSSEVQPEFREYERLSTTAINAYLQPSMDRYLRRLHREVEKHLPNAKLGINQSNGGLMSVERARQLPVRTTLSGPAAGAMGAIHIAQLSACPDVVTLDMGGTSADVCLIRDYTLNTAFDREIGGFPIRLPVVDINSVGAGGGSIAWFDIDGLLKVGPLSAGADPGPACYGKGGSQPTVSDANVILGRLGTSLLGGRLALDLEAARTVMRPVAERLGISIEAAAHGVIEIVNSSMVRAIRVVSIERGHDPRELTLMPFGGAGALHATSVARSLDIRRILVPLLPGILCAQGLIVSDIKEDFVRTIRLPLAAENIDAIERIKVKMRTEAYAWLDREKIDAPTCQLRFSGDLRYVGQNYELSVPIADQPELDLGAILRGFHGAHERHYGFDSKSDLVELVNLRVTALGTLPKPGRPVVANRECTAAWPLDRRPVYFDPHKPTDTAILNRNGLVPGQRIEGPAIVEQMDATALLYPGDIATVDDALNLLIEVGQ
jgi:N-methylhydantoinase A